MVQRGEKRKNGKLLRVSMEIIANIESRDTRWIILKAAEFFIRSAPDICQFRSA